MAFFTETEGPSPGKKYELDESKIVMGRHPECNIVVEVGAVSRQHCQVLQKGEDFLLEDLNSRNHTFLNEVDVFGLGPLKINHGDRIRVCDVTFTFHFDDSPLPVMPSSDSSGSTLQAAVTDESDSSTLSAVMVDSDDVGSTIMSKVDVSALDGKVQFVASPEAKLSALLEITRSLGKAISIDDVLPSVLDSLFKIFVQADRGFIGLKNEQGVLVPRWTKARHENAEDTIRISRTIVNQVMDSKEAILSADAATDDRFEMSQSLADFRIRSMMCAPLVDADGESIGVIQVDTLDQGKRFQQGDLDVLASVATQAGIAIDNANMHEEALRQQSIVRDLQLAHDVQKGFLPGRPPKLDGYEFFDYYEPANHVGGDYYDYISLPDGRVAIIVADVVGHGVAAALMMAKLSAEARYCLASEATPAKAVSVLNDRLSAVTSDRFVTMILCVVNPESHEVTIVNAGHMAPVYRKIDGGIEEPGDEDADLPLGITDGLEYEQVTTQLAVGESMTMYTDGINEAMDVSDQCYGITRIHEHVSNAESVGPRELGEKIIKDVRQFIGESAQDDDMCLVCFRREQAASPVSSVANVDHEDQPREQ